MSTWPDARRLAHGAVRPLPAEEVALHEAVGRTLAADLCALSALPPFDAAAMDGWAVRGPGPWTVVGRVLAGDPPPPVRLQDGEAVEVATGAVVPGGSEGVLPYEEGAASGRIVGGAHPAGSHVRPTGQECARGDLLLPAGSVLTAAGLGLAAAAGHDRLPVRRRARVTVLVTGSELLREGLPVAGRVRDAVGPLLVPSVEALGAEVVRVQHLADDRVALLDAVHAGTELVVTTGASSGGPADHLSGVLAELAAEVLVDGVQVRPGHPQVLARVPGGPVVVGLPGNPLAALCGIVTLLSPLMHGLRGLPLPSPVEVVAGGAVDAHSSSYRLVPVRLDAGTATPVGHGGSAMLRGAALADGFAVVGPGRNVGPGDIMRFLAFP